MTSDITFEQAREQAEAKDADFFIHDGILYRKTGFVSGTHYSGNLWTEVDEDDV